MFKILVIFVSMTTGEPHEAQIVADEFPTIETCQLFLAANEFQVAKEVEKQTNGQVTLKARCIPNPDKPV